MALLVSSYYAGPGAPGRVAQMPLSPSPLIYAKRIAGKGLGVFARVDIEADQEIERVPVIVVPETEVLATPNGGVIGQYAFTWRPGYVAIALGYGSLYNHAHDSNATYRDAPPRTKAFVALRPIRANEEITINYHGEPGCDGPLDFSVR